MSAAYKNIASADTHLVRTGAGVLEKLVINKAVASSTITVYDNTAGSGTKIATITNPATLLHSQMVFPYGIAFTTGLTIVTDQADDITVCWRPGGPT